jgi:type IV pilus assembly protein PilA
MGQWKRRQGFSLIELLVVIAIILVLMAMAIPQYRKAQMLSQETAAKRAIQTIHAAQIQYHTDYGRFAASLAELGPPSDGDASAAGAGLIQPDLATGVKLGYKFTVAASPTGYTIEAEPVIRGSDGTRTFYSDQTMFLREESAGKRGDTGK